MSEHSIDILGQKFSYPSTWQGVVAVLVICCAVVALAYIFDGERIRAVGDAVAVANRDALDASKEALEKASITINNQAREIAQLTASVTGQQSQVAEGDSNSYLVPMSLTANRSDTTTSLDSYLSAQKTLMQKWSSLSELCPNCVPESDADFSSGVDLSERLRELKALPLQAE